MKKHMKKTSWTCWMRVLMKFTTGRKKGIVNLVRKLFGKSEGKID